MAPLYYAVTLSLCVFAFAALATGLTRRYTLRKKLLDVPNERSAHTAPTPRGGGLGIAGALCAALLILYQQEWVTSAVVWAWLGGGVLIAWIGWRDDHGHVPVGWRMLAHLLAAGWAVFWLGGVTQLQLGALTIPLGYVGLALTAVAVVWLINLYNFMDGIDGLAGAEAVFAALGGGLLLWLGHQQGLALASFSLAAAAAGFLVWNWPPAKIFMGDIGSGLLGYSFAVLMLASAQAHAVSPGVWMLLLAVFILDTFFTLVQRILHGEAWLQAHNGHAYQRLLRLGRSHRRVTGYVLALNVLVLWPLAVWVWRCPACWPWAYAGAAGLGWVLWLSIQQRFSATRLIR